MNINIDNIDLLDKGLEYKSKIDALSCRNFKAFNAIMFFGGIMNIIFAIYIGFMTLFEEDGIYIGLAIFLVIGGFLCLAFSLIFPRASRKSMEKKIIEIEKLTYKFEAYKVTVKIVSKSQEINSRMTVNQNQYGSSIHKSTNQKYLVGIRTESGNSAIINSKQLYMGSSEGEYIDILVKQKLDKNGNIIDSAHIPIMETIRATL